MTSIPTNLPYTVNNGLVNPATPGAYLNNTGTGSFPVFCSITSFTNYGMENIVDIAILMPGYKIILYVDAAYAGVATLDTVDATTGVITDGTRAKALRAISTLGTIVMTDTASATTAITVMVDGASFNQGAGATTAGAFGALKDAIFAATGVATTDQVVTSGNGFTSAGAFNLA
jgi:hypothetical protein